MGFCRRCGDIVAGTRCKCGGTAVAPSVVFSKPEEQHSTDKWSRTYVKQSTSTSPFPSSSVRQAANAFETRHSADTKPAPIYKPPARIRNHITGTSLDSRVTSHIHSSVSERSSSPPKNQSKPTEREYLQEDIFNDPYTSTLSKAYGSVLQPKESLKTYACIVCSITFSPDATIYPDPENPTTTTRFMCKSCFISNGGAKGNCVACGRPVTILTNEGGFVQNAGRLWHKHCFRCDGCFKNIGDSPMVDLFGRPSCEACFDTCLKRPSDSPRSIRSSKSTDRLDRASNPGGFKGSSREASPTINELHQRLGIRSRESSPMPERTDTYSRPGSAKKPTTPTLSELSRQLTGILSDNASSPNAIRSTRPSFSGAGDESPTRLLQARQLRKTTSSTSLGLLSTSDRGRDGRSTDERSLRSLIGSPPFRSVSPGTSTNWSSPSLLPMTPDMLSDFSDTNTVSSAPPTPASTSPPIAVEPAFNQKTPTRTPTRTPTKATGVTPVKAPSPLVFDSPNTPCAGCSQPLYRRKGGGKFVTVPEASSKCAPPRSYHVDCFRCAACSKPFEESRDGKTVFVRSSSGYCHVECATPERIVIRPITPSRPRAQTLVESPPKTAPLATSSPFPRFGSMASCPGCRQTVSPMEKGVVPGPHGSRWHVSCLVCGGKGAARRRQDSSEPGCGKRLDSAARTDGDGGVWCRECLLLLAGIPGTPNRDQSPVRNHFTTLAGESIVGRAGGSVQSHMTGGRSTPTSMTTLARQWTGLGLTMQMSGGGVGGRGLIPTRQLTTRSPSPTKMMSVVRPKSVIGTRRGEEGRGMFLVRQMTGGV